jgi:hypothetical protein
MRAANGQRKTACRGNHETLELFPNRRTQIDDLPRDTQEVQWDGVMRGIVIIGVQRVCRSRVSVHPTHLFLSKTSG